MNSARITVCIPTYNRAYFLHQALHSLCDQGLARHEYVVAISDNCSNDQTPNVVEEYRDRLQFVYHRNSETVSQRANWSSATALCKTPYIALLPDDDLLAPGQLGRALSAFDSHKGAVLISAPTVLQEYPGEFGGRIRGMFLRATPQTSYSEPYTWDTTEWFALALVKRQFSIVGSVFQYEALRRCKLQKGYHKVADRLLMAEMALHGDVLSLPWIGGYRRLGKHQTSHQLREFYGNESTSATKDILDLCEKRNLPILEFWVEMVRSSPGHRGYYLSLLRKALPCREYAEIEDAVERRSNKKLDRHPKLRGILKRCADLLRAASSYLSK